jgi:hypothetical protein
VRTNRKREIKGPEESKEKKNTKSVGKSTKGLVGRVLKRRKMTRKTE